MNIEQIRELSKIMDETGLTCLELTEGETVLRLEKAPAVCAPAPAVPAALPGPAAVEPGAPAAPAARGEAVKSPLVGVFYSSPSPDAPAFVKAGSKVRVGDVLCIVEAMKVMNEITAERDGEILEVCASDGQVVEYGQPLFMIG